MPLASPGTVIGSPPERYLGRSTGIHERQLIHSLTADQEPAKFRHAPMTWPVAETFPATAHQVTRWPNPWSAARPPLLGRSRWTAATGPTRPLMVHVVAR